MTDEDARRGKTQLKREVFLSKAKSFGLNVLDPHIEELYAYVQKTLPILKRIEEIDLNDLEPVWPLTPMHQVKPQQTPSPQRIRERVKVREASHKSDELIYLSAGQLSRLIKKKEVSPVEVIETHLSRIEALEPKLNSFITLLPDRAMAVARRAEKEIQAGRYLGPLHGIPFGLKDLFYVKGVRNTSGSKIFDHFSPHFDSTIARRLKEAGAILLGKLNLHPFAYGITGENEEYGHMHNPWNPSLIAGGSSGGSGSAVASGECTLAMGTDTGGSIRVPGALCGLVGLKPTYGRLSRYGVTALAWSQDHPGPMARTVEDCALMMNAMAGYDSRDPFSLNLRVPDYTQALRGDIKGLRLGVVKEFFEVPIEPKIKESVCEAIDTLGGLGAIVSEVSWPIYHDAMAIASVIQMVEATAYHAKLIKVNASRIYPPARLRLEAGIFIPATDYVQAQRARTLFCRQSYDLFKKVDILAGPTVPVTAFPIGTSKVKIGEKKLNLVSLMSQYTRPFNLNGFPAITIPCGFSKDRLPIGLQLAGRPFDEESLFRIAHVYERTTEWHRQRPPVTDDR
jgi:aspartyl-tRNA(Asn)/glutamyl-tRNA(Gln) amidotransferase subunit A